MDGDTLRRKNTSWAGSESLWGNEAWNASALGFVMLQLEILITYVAGPNFWFGYDETEVRTGVGWCLGWWSVVWSLEVFFHFFSSGRLTLERSHSYPMFRLRKSECFESERFTMTVARVLTRGEMFDDCGCANKWEWVSVISVWGGSSGWRCGRKSWIYFHKNDIKIASDCIGFHLLRGKFPPAGVGGGGISRTPLDFRVFLSNQFPCLGIGISLGRNYCEKRNIFNLVLKGGRVQQCLRTCGSEFQMWGPT